MSYSGREHPAEKPFWHSRTSMVRTCGTTAEYFRRMLKKAVQQGRSERRGEEVHTALRLGRSPVGWILANGKAPTVLPTSEKPLLNVEDLNDARTKLVDFFSILPVSFPGSADHDCRVPFQRTHRGATSWDLPTNLNWKPGGVAIAVSPVWMKPDGALWRALSSRRR